MRTNKPMINHIPITQARINLGALFKRAHLQGEYFIVEKDGIPIAGIMGADELEDYLELQDPEFQRGIAESKADIKAGRTFPARNLLIKAKQQSVRRRPANQNHR